MFFHSGRVVNVTSVQGLLTVPACGPYAMTKAAAESFSDGLRREMRKFGLKVSVIEPGKFGGATNMLNNVAVGGLLCLIVSFFSCCRFMEFESLQLFSFMFIGDIIVFVFTKFSFVVHLIIISFDIVHNFNSVANLAFVNFISTKKN